MNMKTNYSVEPRVFELFPGFRRGVVVAAGINNTVSSRETASLLASEITRIGAAPSIDETAKIEAWNAAFRAFDVDPKKYTPSVAFLHDQIRRGKPPRSISPVVDLFNVMSLRWTVPCGGDDLDAIGADDIRLGLASGNETFAPLFKPGSLDHPAPEEIIYSALQSGRVMCRRWTWRNADFSKIRPDTKCVAINIDMMIPPCSESSAERAVQEMADLVQQFCGGNVSTHVLSPSAMSLEIER
jgi:lysyl-tRNA synthetase class 2